MRHTFSIRIQNGLKVKEWIKIACEKGNPRKTNVAILRLYNIDHKAKSICRDKEKHFIMIHNDKGV